MSENPALFSFENKNYSDSYNILSIWKSIQWLRINDHMKKKTTAKSKLFYESW